MIVRLSKEKVTRRMSGRFHSLGQLADALEVQQPTISAWFGGDFDPRLSTLGKLCSLLGCTVDQIVDYIPDELAGADASFLAALTPEPNGDAVGVVA